MAGEHWALYGTTRMLRGTCEQCQTTALIIDQKFACCGARVESEAQFAKRMCHPEQCRRRPSKETQLRLLAEYHNCCAYCDGMIGGLLRRKGKLVKRRLHWDHNIPWSYSQDNSDENFLPSCHICNAIKSDLMFKTVEEVRIYVATHEETTRDRTEEL